MLRRNGGWIRIGRRGEGWLREHNESFRGERKRAERFEHAAAADRGRGGLWGSQGRFPNGRSGSEPMCNPVGVLKYTHSRNNTY